MSFPSKFGKYLLLERVNVGGMAEVFKAKAFGVAGFERILAVKRILPNLIEDDEFVRMFIDEARIAVQLTHANIVQIYELGKHGEHYYIAMEYIPSRDLRGILDRLRANGQLMPISQAAFLTARVADGLDYAHRRKDAQGAPMNIIHRDVSPQNVLVGFEGEVKVIDFGIAKAANRASKTQAGVLKGKFGYMSPEQVRGLPIDRRSDIFAVGVLLYEMLTGERLFIGESDFSTLERVRNADVPPPSQFNKKISPQLENIVLKTLAREVEDRYQWASDLAHDLQPFIGDNAGAFSPRRLALSMKEMYAAEVAAERAKLEDFLRINPDDVKERGAPLTSSVLPLPQRAGQQPSPLAAQARNAPPQGPAAAGFDDEPDENEDKTFVIEANAAGAALQRSTTDTRGKHGHGGRGSGGLTRSDDAGASDDVSLYGDGGPSVEDDAHTMISPEAARAAARKPSPTPPAPTPSAPPSPAAAQRSKSPRQPEPAPAPPPPRAGRSFDAVAAALAEEDPDALAAIGGPASAAPPWVPSSSALPFGVLPRSDPAIPTLGAVVASAPATNPASAADNAFAPTSTTPPAGVEAVTPPPRVAWAPLIAAAALSLVAFVASAAFVATRAFGPTSGELEVLAAGGPVPADVRVVVDNAVVASALPARVPLSVGAHTLQVTGSGMLPLQGAVVGTGGLVRQVVAVVPPPAPAGTEASPDPTVAATAPSTVPAASGVPPAVSGGWRLSLAAIDDAGASVVGAAVLVNGVAYGETPFEGELDASLTTVEVKVAKSGFSPTVVTVQRNARATVGPATVSLKAEGGAAATATTTTTPDSPSQAAAVGPKVDGEKPATGTTEPERPPPRVEPAKETARESPREELKDQPKEPSKEQPRVASVRDPAPDPPREPARTPAPKTDAQREPRATSREVADIELGTSPSAETTIDGRKYGSTPFFGPKKLTLPVGTHRVEFFDKSTNKKYRYQIKLKKASPTNKVIIQFNRNDPPLVKGEVEMKKLD
jgi:serine/threonine protein kinase